MALEQLIPKFAHDSWRVVHPNARGEVRNFDALTDFVSRGNVGGGAAIGEEALQLEAKPTIWAHAETFRIRLEAAMRDGLGPNHADFQVWGGLLAALFQGDLQVLRLSGAEIDSIDEDLRPALVSSLPFDVEDREWAEELSCLHRHGSVVLLVAGTDQVVLAGGYAPCLVFPARRQPLVTESGALSVFDNEHLLYPDLQLNELMRRYCRQQGFADAFAKTIDELVMRLAGGGPDRLKEALELLSKTVRAQWGEGASPGKVAADCRDSTEGVLPYRFKGPGPEVTLQGGAGVWDMYRYQAVGRDGRPVLFIPENVDPHLNPWVNEQAFPEVDVHTRFKDLRIHLDAEGRVLFVTGRNNAVYEVPSDHHVLSLDPQAPLEYRAVLDAVMFFDGRNRAVRNELLDPIHAELRKALTSRDDVTLLIPLHVELLRHFSGLAANPGAFVKLTDGSIGERQSETVGCSLILPLRGRESHLELEWRASLMAWKHAETCLPQTDVWPAVRSHPSSRVQWSAYFLRSWHTGESLATFFHGENQVRRREATWETPREGAEALHSYDFLAESPRFAEVFHAENPAVTLGLVFLSRGVYQEAGVAAAVDLAIDFGTTNTSVAFRSEGDSRPELLRYGAWSRPILDRQGSEIIEREPQPGWFMEDLSRLSLESAPEPPNHSGFFSTLLAYEKWLAVDEMRLAKFRSSSDARSEELARLIGSVEMPGLKPNLAMLLLDGSYPEWDVVDELKWSTENDDSEQRRKAFRAIFLELLLLHALIECFVRTGDLPAKYHFTYPLSMPREEVNEFKLAMGYSPRSVERLIDPSRGALPEVAVINESQAAFRAFLHVEEQEQLVPTARAVLIDMGGGSADYAVFTGGMKDAVAFLDSLHLAGDQFFQFLRDLSGGDEHELLVKSVQALFEDRLPVPQPDELKREQVLRRFRREYNVTVCAEMPGKGAGRFEQDPDLVRARVDRTASDLRRELDQFSAAHWMRALFKTVVTHGLLLGVAPIDGVQSSNEHLDLVLLGNGWGLLHHAGVPRESVQELVRDCYVLLRRFLESQEARSGGKEPSKYPDAESVTVRFMDEQIGRSFGMEIFSKDVISIGAILAEEEEDSANPLGILGHEIQVRALGGAGRDGRSGGPILLPWHLPVEKRRVDSYVNEIIDGRGDDGTKHDDYPLAGRKVVALQAEPLQPRIDGGHCLLEQLLALDLLRTGGYGGHPRDLLEGRDWAFWNQAVNASVRELVQVYGERARGERERFTSLITDLWEYSLTKEVVRRQLFQRMQEP